MRMKRRTGKPCIKGASMGTVIKIIGNAMGIPGPEDGLYVKFLDPDIGHGKGFLDLTDDISEARVFATAGAAFAYWKLQSRRYPFRPDGKPNRPLTAFTCEFIKLEGE